jgi:hypothetical protein
LQLCRLFSDHRRENNSPDVSHSHAAVRHTRKIKRLIASGNVYCSVSIQSKAAA